MLASKWVHDQTPRLMSAGYWGIPGVADKRLPQAQALHPDCQYDWNLWFASAFASIFILNPFFCLYYIEFFLSRLRATPRSRGLRAIRQTSVVNQGLGRKPRASGQLSLQ
jgi:hypothetical protein